MRERNIPEANFTAKSGHEKMTELNQGRDDLMEAKKEHLAYVKDACMEVFGTERLPKEFVQELIDIRKQIASKVEATEYLDDVEVFTQQQIAQLAVKIANYKNPRGVERAAIDEKGQISVVTAESRLRPLSENEEVLVNSLELYFDTYRMAQNSFRFTQNIKGAEKDIVHENSNRKLNFYADKDKRKAVVERIQEKYLNAGFTNGELSELVETCSLPDLDKLQVHDLKTLVKIREIFQKFMGGDKTKYVALSAGLLVPAFINGYAPMVLANAFKGGNIDVTQVGLYALLSSASAGSSIFVEKQFTAFLNKNFSKEKGIGQSIATNVAELPADQIASFGVDDIKVNISQAKDSYEDIYRLISFDILPAVVTLTTSAAMLYEKSPVLAGATAVGTGIMMALDKYLEKATSWHSKRRAAKQQTQDVSRQITEQLNAHLEIILSGMKDELATRMEALLTKERLANSDKKFSETLRDNVREFSGALNLIIAGLVSYLAGATTDKFFATLIYSGNFQGAVSKMLKSKSELLGAFREIQEMDLMFNGYAAEEAEKEKTRVGVSAVNNSDIDLKDVEVSFEGKKIIEISELHIPQGSMANLSGASGAGKTTLMKVISGYYRPTSGAVEFGHVNMDQIKKSGGDSIYASISYLPQFPYILEDTVRKNVIFGLNGQVGDDKIQEVLKEVGLAERFKNLNEPLKGGRGDMGTASGGEASRIGLARILLKVRNTNSRLVFLDEPTASVDEKTRNEIADIINKEKAARPQVTFVVISHDRDFVSRLNCDIEVRMEKGKVTKES